MNKQQSRREFVRKAALTGVGAAVFPNMLQSSMPEETKEGGLGQSLVPEFLKEKPVLKLWYRQPAGEWMKSTPIGNGRLGAMIFGGIENDRVALNEITMWVGQPDPNQELPCGKEKLAEIRDLFFNGKLKEGNDLANKYLSGKPNTYGTNIPVGDLNLQFGHDGVAPSEYNREVDIENSITTVSYKIGNVHYKREYFCSNPDDVIVIRLSADSKQSVNFSLSLDLLSKAVITASGNQLEFAGKASSKLKVNGFPDFASGGVDFAGRVNVSIIGGNVEADNGELKIAGANEAVVIIDIRTNYVSDGYKKLCEDTVRITASKKYDSIKSDHIKDYSRLFKRVEIDLGSSDAHNLPTDLRMARYNEGNPDPAFCALFMQYNRYLLISCSRENSPLPANLQGVWNDNLAANMPWTCDYHLDINTQQNYWAANIANLQECNSPLFDFIAYLSKHGEKTAEKVYGSPGWVAHTVTNVWGYTAPGEWPGWGLFPTASTWLALHLWEHYNYTRDIYFLKNKAYPLLKKNAEFFMDYMVVDPHSGYLMTGPCTSPENSFLYEGSALSLSMMPTCDRVFIHELFTSCISASKLLNTDKKFSASLAEALDKLPPIKIGRNGEIQEWFEDYEKAQPNHRHTTHLTALYPYSQISLTQTPDLAAASAKTIQYRLDAPGWEDVEWSRANMINYFARLKEAEKAHDSINILLKDLTRENLFTISVAGIAGANNDIFAFDGNQAAAAGIAEMLVQSHEDFIEFLPALPKAWGTGYYKGLCVRGGATASLSWKNMVIEKVSFQATASNSFNIKLPGIAKARFLKNGKTYSPSSLKGDIVVIKLDKKDHVEVFY